MGISAKARVDAQAEAYRKHMEEQGVRTRVAENIERHRIPVEPPRTGPPAMRWTGTESTISAAFAEFHRENPHVYDHLVRLAKRGRARGATKLGMKQLFEVLRWQVMLSTTDPDFKLNNNYTAHYARLIMDSEPDLEGMFEVRRSGADDVLDS